MEKVRIGIVGSVGHAEKFVNLINSYPDSEAVAYCAQDALSTEIANRLGVPVEPDYQAMLDNYSLDGVIITVPNMQKRDMVIAAARAQVSVFLEKPLAVRMEDAMAMQEAVHGTGIKFYMSDPFIRPGILMLKKQIARGELGTVIGANVRLANDRGIREAHLPHIYDRTLSGGGIMADVGGHALHIIHYLFGQPVALCSSLRGYTDDAKKAGIEENASVILRYGDGMTVTLEASWISGGVSSNRTVVYGTDGWAEVLDQPGGEGTQLLRVHQGDGTTIVYDSAVLPKMPTRHVRYFVEMMRGDLPNDIIGTVDESNCGVSIDDAVELVKIIAACYEAPDARFVSL